MNYGKRNDGTMKDVGFLGEVRRPDGKVMTELSVGLNFGDGEVEVPTLVPTLKPEELEILRNLKEDEDPPRSIVDKAAAYAVERMRQGKNPFYSSETEKDWNRERALADVLRTGYNNR